MSLRRPFAASAAAALLTLAATAAHAGFIASPAATANAGPWTLAPGEYYTELSGLSFESESYYDDAKQRTDFGGRYSQRAFRSYTDLGWKNHLSAQLSIPLVTNTTRFGASGQTITGLEDFGLGLRWKLKNGGTGAAIQARWEAPAGYNNHLPISIGDGLQKLSASLQLGGAAGKSGFWELGGGYRYDYRSVAKRESGTVLSGPGPATDGAHDWSDHVTVNAAYGFWYGRVLFAGMYAGEFPVSTGRSYETTAHAAGPRVTYRVDERLDAFAGSWHTPAGQNVPHLDAYYAGVAWKLTKLNRLQGFLGSDKRP